MVDTAEIWRMTENIVETNSCHGWYMIVYHTFSQLIISKLGVSCPVLSGTGQQHSAIEKVL